MQQQVRTERSSKFLIVLLKRGAETYSNKVTVTDDIMILDNSNTPRTYTPISVIYHRGGIGKQGRGSRHYLCDILNKVDGSWYKTSDSSQPQRLSKREVATDGYIILYRRVS